MWHSMPVGGVVMVGFFVKRKTEYELRISDWSSDVCSSDLLDTLVAEKLRAQSEGIRAEGWKWIDVAPDFAYGHTYSLRQLRGEQIPLTDEEQDRKSVV